LDRELVEAARNGDREAFGLLAHSNADWLFAVAQRILRDFDRAEDAVQETLVATWRELPSLRDPERFQPWLRRILVRVCYEESRRSRSTASVLHVLATDRADPGDDILTVADRDELERGFRRLPAEHRAILVLHHYLGMSPGEIAETLGMPGGTARSRLHYAHRAMRAALEADSRPPAAEGRGA
jgi:RNA polymerase sigma-70 factor (ECF subfamily)